MNETDIIVGVIVTSYTIDKKTRNYKKLENRLEIDKNVEIRLEISRFFF